MELGDIGKILPSEPYTVDLQEELPVSYTSVLTHLYQPLIGLEAVMLYQTLFSEWTLSSSSSSLQTHHALMSYLSIPLDQVYRARRKLEGIGLLQTFEQNDQQETWYHYRLLPPRSGKLFFEDDFLNHLLYHQLGHDKYRQVKKLFQQPVMTNDHHQETTARFDEIFSVKEELQTPSDQGEQVLSSDDQFIKVEQRIDFDWITQLLKQRMLPEYKILTKENRHFLNQLAVVYDLTNQELEKALLWSLTEENELNKQEFEEACIDLFEGKGKQFSLKAAGEREKLPAKQENDQKQPKNKEEQFIEMLENISPKQLLEDLAGGTQASTQDLKMVSDIMTKQGLNPGVMNVLLHYVMLKTDMKLTRSYLEKIASHWARKNVKTVRQAMTLAKSENKKYQQWTQSTNRNNYKSKKDIVPDWYKQQKQNSKESNQSSHQETEEERKQKAMEADAMLEEYLQQQANDE
ncbi:DNA replication protein DnaB [Gracilibacillus halophilus YIM-C55.5]|uniref:DNA replication protein DnaB n=1 Tax=Gracilibacillus halophilus YIM-C55.5 TaxID=1308866 RepID=N4WCW9_9BACI|nr:DnaD domain protein [Gracilibacillus halophilus]ENH97059.1 DNA replication protein DnaB [Gracilibacillus halophilus YIM-C55.5]